MPARVLDAGGLLGASEWVVPRAQLSHRRIDYGALAPRQRADAARIALQRDAFPGDLHRLAWRAGIAHVWTWQPETSPNARVRAGWMPESLLQAPPGESDAIRLLRQLEGVEGQVWRGGDLVASQWWADVPALGDWQRFLRGASVGPEAGARVPEPEAGLWSPPWARVRGRASGGSVGERWAWRAVALTAAAVIGWQWAALDGERAALARLQADMDALRAASMPLLDARERADAARADIERLRALQRGSSDYSLMVAVRAPLPEDARVTSWDRKGEKLTVRIEGGGADPREFVRAYESVRLLSNVQAAPVGGVGLGTSTAAASLVTQTTPANGGLQPVEAPPAVMDLEFELPDAFRTGSGE